VCSGKRFFCNCYAIWDFCVLDLILILISIRFPLKKLKFRGPLLNLLWVYQSKNQCILCALLYSLTYNRMYNYKFQNLNILWEITFFLLLASFVCTCSCQQVRKKNSFMSPENNATICPVSRLGKQMPRGFSFLQ
jgi:hypothetical protein